MSILNLSWSDYVARVKSADEGDARAMSNRMKVVEAMRRLFSKGEPFSEFTSDEQKMVAGVATFQGVDYGWFSPMTSARERLIDVAHELSDAIDAIPMKGQVPKEMFGEYVKRFKRVEAKLSKQVGMSSYTRPLAMKRPDVFVCISQMNDKALCTDFGIEPQTVFEKARMEKYWDSVIMPVQNSPWWQSAMPSGELDRTIWEWRTAFLDPMYVNRQSRRTDS